MDIQLSFAEFCKFIACAVFMIASFMVFGGIAFATSNGVQIVSAIVGVSVLMAFNSYLFAKQAKWYGVRFKPEQLAKFQRIVKTTIVIAILTSVVAYFVANTYPAPKPGGLTAIGIFIAGAIWLISFKHLLASQYSNYKLNRKELAAV